ncbi:MAG: hypothetical protein ACK58L_17710 [Planctomycetota bacterium]
MKSEDYIGKTAVVGITQFDEHEKLLGRSQCHARILRINNDEGMVLENLIDGGEFSLPPEVSFLKPALYEIYELSNGIVVEDPDFEIVLRETIYASQASASVKQTGFWKRFTGWWHHK